MIKKYQINKYFYCNIDEKILNWYFYCSIDKKI